jgi:hypothetical protein
MDPSDLMGLDRPTAAVPITLLLGRGGSLHPRNEESGHGPKSSQSLLEHAFVHPGRGPSRGQRIGARLMSEEKM